ncbi:hypothetical protein ACVIYH_000091 [Bradyrhizobium diazoefficiens]
MNSSPSSSERDLHAIEKVLEIDNVLQHLARDDEIEFAGLRHGVVTHRRADHVGIDLDAALAGDLARHRVGLHADQNLRAALAKLVHEQAVVAADLEHGLMLREFRDGIELVDLVRLRLPAAEIVVELAIQDVGIDRLDDLRQTAIAAGEHLERIPFLLLVPAVPEPMRNRHLPEVDDRSKVGRMAEAAMVGHWLFSHLAGLTKRCSMKPARPAMRWSRIHPTRGARRSPLAVASSTNAGSSRR